MASQGEQGRGLLGGERPGGGRGLINHIAYPESGHRNPDRRYFGDEDWEDLVRFRSRTALRLASAPNLLPRAARKRSLYAGALRKEATEGVRAFAAMIPKSDDLQPEEEFGRLGSLLKRQAQLAVLAFRAGVAVSADLWLGGFDTHEQHDRDQAWLLANLTDSVDFLWDNAEIHGVADRLVVVIGSDFGRTNHYNADAGKDHWPIGSFVVMEKNRPWTNRVVGETDELHFAHKVNPSSLQRDDVGGSLIYPKHIGTRRCASIWESRAWLRADSFRSATQKTCRCSDDSSGRLRSARRGGHAGPPR